MPIFTQQSALRPLLFSALFGFAGVGACIADEPGIKSNKAAAGAANGLNEGNESDGIANRSEPSAADEMQTAGAPPSGGAGEPTASAGGTDAVQPELMAAAGARGESEGGAGGFEPVDAAACAFHTPAPPLLEGAGGDGSASPTVVVQQSVLLGAYLTDASGRTLYVNGGDFPGDCEYPPISYCEADCPVTWPIFDAGARSLGPGLDDAAFGRITRGDGLLQTTYFGWPLYYNKSDLTLGQLSGQGKAKVWHAAKPTPASIVIMKLGTTKYLADGVGHTLYVSAADRPAVSNCAGACLSEFDPFHAQTLSVVTSLEATDFAAFALRGGAGLQMTFKGMPLYRASGDLRSGDMSGSAIAGFTAALP